MLKDYKPNIIVSIECQVHGEWKRKYMGMDTSSLHHTFTDDEVTDAICSYFPSVLKDGILFYTRVDNPDVMYSDIERWFKCAECRRLVDDTYRIGKTVVVNKRLFDQYVQNGKMHKSYREDETA